MAWRDRVSLDKEGVLDRLAGDEGLMLALFQVVLEDAPIKLKGMRQAMEASEPEDLCRRAHSLKGALATVGMERARDLVNAIEDATDDIREGEDMQRIQGLMGELDQEVDHALGLIRKELANQDTR